MGNGESRVNEAAVGVAVGFGILAILFTIGIVQFCCKYKCNKCKKCCKKKEPSLKDKMLIKVGLKKSPPPFSISSTIKWQSTGWQLNMSTTTRPNSPRHFNRHHVSISFCLFSAPDHSSLLYLTCLLFHCIYTWYILIYARHKNYMPKMCHFKNALLKIL